MDNGVDLSGALGKLIEDPEALKKAMKIAAELKKSGAVDGLFSAPEKAAPAAYRDDARSYTGVEENDAGKAGEWNDAETANRKKLLQALRPYIGVERREKLDAIIRLLDLLKLASSFGFGRTD